MGEVARGVKAPRADWRAPVAAKGMLEDSPPGPAAKPPAAGANPCKAWCDVEESRADELIVIFGARLTPDGRPSRALRRRIDGGAASADAHPNAQILCSGAARRPGEPSEASIIGRELTAAGVAPHRLILDETSRDTLQSVLVVCRLAADRAAARCIVCSDTYHLPRIRLMLALMGVASAPGAVERGLKDAGLARWLGMVLREAAAIPYDGAIVLVRGKRLLAASAP